MFSREIQLDTHGGPVTLATRWLRVPGAGLQIRITGLIGTYTDPHILIAYSDGEVRQEFTFVYSAEVESGEFSIDSESREGAGVDLFQAVHLPLAESQRRRLVDVQAHKKQQSPFLK